MKIMEIAKNIENARSKRQPKPSKEVLKNVEEQKKEKDQKNARGKKNDPLKLRRHSPRIKDLAPSFGLQISQLWVDEYVSTLVLWIFVIDFTIDFVLMYKSLNIE